MAAHHELALAAGAAPDELDAVADGESDGLDAKTAAAVAYASALAQAEFRPVPEARAELAEFLSDEEFDDVELIARAMTVVNRLGNTLDALRSRRAGRPDPSGRLLDELVLSALILAAAVPVLLIGARRGRKLPSQGVRPVARGPLERRPPPLSGDRGRDEPEQQRQRDGWGRHGRRDRRRKRLRRRRRGRSPGRARAPRAGARARAVVGR